MISGAIGLVGTSVLSCVSMFDDLFNGLPGAVIVYLAGITVLFIVRYLLQPIVGAGISVGSSDFVRKHKTSERRGRGK